MADFTTWKNGVLGVSLNIDGSFGAQCVDVDLSWGQACFPNVPWSTLFPPVPSAKDMFDKYNPTYWVRVANNYQIAESLAADVAPPRPAGHQAGMSADRAAAPAQPDQ